MSDPCMDVPHAVDTFSPRRKDESTYREYCMMLYMSHGCKQSRSGLERSTGVMILTPFTEPVVSLIKTADLITVVPHFETLHGVFVGEWLFVFPLCGFSLSLFCNYFETWVFWVG